MKWNATQIEFIEGSEMRMILSLSSLGQDESRSVKIQPGT